MAGPTDVSTPSAVYNAQKDCWELPRTLMRGTRAMRHANIKYLPKEPGELTFDYEARKSRSFLFNAFRKTVKDMTGKVFQREIVLKDDVPQLLKDDAENIDLAGRSLNVFARDVFMDGLQTGINFILVDMPEAPKGKEGKPATRADENAAGIRPYFCHVKVEDLIGWQSQQIGGVETLTQVRILEHVLEPDGPYNEKMIDQIRVLTPGSWSTFRKSTQPNVQNQWILFETGTTSLNKITLCPVYINRTGFMTGEPPLEDLADLNVAHWQSQSDQRNILHVARVPILYGAGFGSEAVVVIGANTMVRNNSPDAKLTYVEHTGQAIGAGATDLDNLQFQMQTMGLQLLIAQPGGKTATGEIRDDAKENSPLAMMANALGDAIEQALGFAAEYRGITATTTDANETNTDKIGGSVEVNTDFGVSIGPADLQLLQNAVAAGDLSKETFWQELQRRDVLSADFDADVEKDRLQEEAPELTAPNPMDLGGGQPGGKPPVKPVALPGSGSDNGDDTIDD